MSNVKSDQLAKIKQNETALSVPDDMVDLFAEDAGGGMEEMSKEDFAIPRIAILQKLSPQVDKNEAEYIEGANPSDFFDNVTNRHWAGSDGIVVIPIHYRKTHIEWGLREKGGGFVAEHGPDTAILENCTRDEKKRYINPDGNQIVPTAEYYVFLYEPDTGAYAPSVISMASSQLSKSRKWNTAMNQLRVKNSKGGSFNPAMFYRSYLVTTVPEKNDQGTWFGYKITPAQDTITLTNGKEIYLAARDFREKILEGAVKVKNPVVETAEGDDEPM